MSNKFTLHIRRLFWVFSPTNVKSEDFDIIDCSVQTLLYVSFHKNVANGENHVFVHLLYYWNTHKLVVSPKYLVSHLVVGYFISHARKDTYLFFFGKNVFERNYYFRGRHFSYNLVNRQKNLPVGIR